MSHSVYFRRIMMDRRVVVHARRCLNGTFDANLTEMMVGMVKGASVSYVELVTESIQA